MIEMKWFLKTCAWHTDPPAFCYRFQFNAEEKNRFFSPFFFIQDGFIFCLLSIYCHLFLRHNPQNIIWWKHDLLWLREHRNVPLDCPFAIYTLSHGLAFGHMGLYNCTRQLQKSDANPFSAQFQVVFQVFKCVSYFKWITMLPYCDDIEFCLLKLFRLM